MRYSFLVDLVLSGSRLSAACTSALIAGMLLTSQIPAFAGDGTTREAPRQRGFPVGPRAQPVRFLLITLDTLRADHLGAYGYQQPTSPAIDRFATTATLFRDVTCSMPTTLPSHLSIFTGLTPAQHGITENGMVSDREQCTVFSLLRRRGAATAAIVSAKVLSKQYLAGLGFDEILYGDGRTPAAYQLPGDAVTEQAGTWLQHHKDSSFALCLHYFDTHEPYTPPPRQAARFTTGYRGELTNSLDTSWLVSLNQPTVIRALSQQDRQHVANLYDAEIAALDNHLQRLFQLLKKLDLWQETLIVIVGDHGQAHGEQGFWGHGERLLEPVVQVPLLIKLPSQEQAQTVSEPVETIDILPTVAAYFGLPVPAGRTGQVVIPALTGETLQPDRVRLIERRSYASAPQRRGLALHAGTWKLLWYREAEGEYYHLGKRSGAGGLDGENLLTADAPELQLLPTALFDQKVPATGSRRLSKESQEMLRSLGYLQ